MNDVDKKRKEVLDKISEIMKKHDLVPLGVTEPQWNETVLIISCFRILKEGYSGRKMETESD
jgi:hypothetical protein